MCLPGGDQISSISLENSNRLDPCVMLTEYLDNSLLFPHTLVKQSHHTVTETRRKHVSAELVRGDGGDGTACLGRKVEEKGFYASIPNPYELAISRNEQMPCSLFP